MLPSRRVWYFTNTAAEKGKILGRDTPAADTVEQAFAYREAAPP